MSHLFNAPRYRTAAAPRAALVFAITGVLLVTCAAGFAWWLMARKPAALAPDWIPSVVVLAGTGVPGVRDGVAHTAQFSDPFGVAVAQDGTIFVSDAGESHSVRRISPAGIVTTIAGGARGFADGTGRSARFDTPSAIALAADGALIVADTANNAIRRIAADGVTTTLAGSGEPGHRDGVAHDAQFNAPIGVAVDRMGRVLVADTYNDRIRMIAGGIVTTLAGGGGPGLVDAFGAEARFDTPCGVAIDKDGYIFVADSGNSAIRRIDVNGYVATASGPGAEAISRPVGIATGENGVLFVTDERGRIIEIARQRIHSHACRIWRRLPRRSWRRSDVPPAGCNCGAGGRAADCRRRRKRAGPPGRGTGPR